MARAATTLALSLAGVTMGVDMGDVNESAPPSVVRQFAASSLGLAAASVFVNSSGSDAPPAGFSYLVDTSGNYLVDRAGAYLVGSPGPIVQQFFDLFGANDGRYEAVAGSNILTDSVNGARTLAVGAGTVANAAADADYGSKPSLILSGTQYLQSNQPTSFWPSLHGSADSTLILVHKFTGADAVGDYLYTTSDASTSQVGIAILARGPSSNNVGAYVCNNSGGFATFSDPMAAAVFTPTYLDVSVASGAGGFVVRRKSATILTATLAAPSSSNPARTLRVGANSSAGGHLTVRALYHWRRALSAEERAIAQAYILFDTGITP